MNTALTRRSEAEDAVERSGWEASIIMKTIWKWNLLPQGEINMPAGAELLTVQEQHGRPQLWAIVDQNAELVPRKFSIYGTGHQLPDNPGKYVGTIQTRDGHLVFHVFEG